MVPHDGKGGGERQVVVCNTCSGGGVIDRFPITIEMILEGSAVLTNVVQESAVGTGRPCTELRRCLGGERGYVLQMCQERLPLGVCLRGAVGEIFHVNLRMLFSGCPPGNGN